jgi:hypothetical protein
MIPVTKNGLNAMTCVSAMQKSIRRALEREAMEFACELKQTSHAFHTMVCNRLEVICGLPPRPTPTAEIVRRRPSRGRARRSRSVTE